MRILHTVESYSPSVGGMQEVVRQLSERLAARGHDVTVATSKMGGREGDLLNRVRIREFDVSGNLVDGMRGDVSGYREFLRSGGSKRQKGVVCAAERIGRAYGYVPVSRWHGSLTSNVLVRPYP